MFFTEQLICVLLYLTREKLHLKKFKISFLPTTMKEFAENEYQYLQKENFLKSENYVKNLSVWKTQ